MYNIFLRGVESPAAFLQDDRAPMRQIGTMQVPAQSPPRLNAQQVMEMIRRRRPQAQNPAFGAPVPVQMAPQMAPQAPQMAPQMSGGIPNMLGFYQPRGRQSSFMGAYGGYR